MMLCGPAWAQAPQPLPIRMVVVTMFEIGQDTGDTPGEFQNWVEKFPLPQAMPFPQGYRQLRYNPEKGVLGIVTGVGTARAAASIMALGMDPRFDLRKAYWLVAGIAGVDPHRASLGSAAWADWVVDADLGHEIDAREIPPDWPTGKIPLNRKRPYEQPPAKDNGGAAYRLDPALVNWAYGLTRDIVLADSEPLQKLRAHYAGFPEAQKPPFVLKGDDLSGENFWHGKLMNDWAERWVAYWTGGAGQFTMTAMEDTGTLQALTWLTHAGRADVTRALVLRTASNYSMQYPGETAAQSLSHENAGGYSAFIPSLVAAYRVGSRVAAEISDHWDRYADHPPQGGKP
ncbi:MAG TPA: purine nucleoside permease [Stellaceae bacterium]